MKKDKLEWDGDEEERLAMEKVHSLNDFDDSELNGKFNTMDEVSGDDDWRALASQTDASTVVNPALDLLVGTLSQDGQQPAAETMAAAAQGFPQQQVLMGEMQLVDDSGSTSGIRIMRFTRKKTSFQRGRRTSLLLQQHQPLLQQQQQQQQQLKAEHEGVGPSVPSAEVAPPAAVEAAPPVDKKAVIKSELVDSSEDKSGLVKARSVEDIMGEKSQARKAESTKKSALDEQPSKRPKALAFQKSRNIINKRINGETFKPEPAMSVNCSEVKAMQEMHSTVSAEWRAVQEEVRAASGKDEDALKQLPLGLHERWFKASCNQLGTKFDVQFAAVQHFLCHQRQNCA